MRSFKDRCYSEFNAKQVKAWRKKRRILDADELYMPDLSEGILMYPHGASWLIPALIGIPGYVFQCASLVRFALIWLMAYPAAVGIIVLIVYNELAIRNARRWVQGGYADSEWYRRLDDGEKLHVRAWFESEQYRRLDRDLARITRVPMDDCMREAVSMLDNAVSTAERIRGEMPGTDCTYALHAADYTIGMYRKYRDAFSNGVRTTKLPFPALGTTGLTHRNEEILRDAVSRYNKQVDEVRRNASLIDTLETMMGSIRAAVGTAPHGNSTGNTPMTRCIVVMTDAAPHANSTGNMPEAHWAQENAVITEMEEVAYHGFDNE